MPPVTELLHVCLTRGPCETPRHTLCPLPVGIRRFLGHRLLGLSDSLVGEKGAAGRVTNAQRPRSFCSRSVKPVQFHFHQTVGVTSCACAARGKEEPEPSALCQGRAQTQRLGCDPLCLFILTWRQVDTCQSLLSPCCPGLACIVIIAL